MSKHLVLNSDICLLPACCSQCLPTGREYLCLYQPSSPIAPTSLASRAGNFTGINIQALCGHQGQIPTCRVQTTASAPQTSPPSKCPSGSPTKEPAVPSSQSQTPLSPLLWSPFLALITHCFALLWSCMYAVYDLSYCVISMTAGMICPLCLGTQL